MELMNVLSGVPISFYGETFEVSLGWLGNLIRLLTVGVGSVGVGIILFSLILKAITLPFDVYQRVAMCKQNQKMKENQARMEKLQKQYANDKQAYNQKVMEMYKENGISMFSSCLPMILSLVIFFVAINAFHAFSRSANIENYNTMVDAYNAKIESYCPDLEQKSNEDYNARMIDTVTFEYVIEVDAEGKAVLNEEGKENVREYILVKEPNGANKKYIYYEVTSSPEAKAYFTEKAETTPYTEADKIYQKTVWKMKNDTTVVEKIVGYVENIRYVEKSYKIDRTLAENDGIIKAEDTNEALVQYFENEAQQAVYDVYYAEDGVLDNTRFLWIKNIWATDASYKSPVMEFSNFETEIGAVGGGCGGCSSSEVNFVVGNNELNVADMGAYTGVYSEVAYNKITGKLAQEKEQANGYYVLIVLSIGTILLQQFITMRSQKEQQKFSSVDGQGGSQQKMTMIIMTGMFAIFSFMYSSAFSIYMVMSNVISLLSTILINKLVDVKLAKKEAAAMQAKYDKRLPRTTQNDKKNKK